MRTSELEGKYARLRVELEDAYAAPAWPVGHIDRLTTELTEVEQSLQRRYGSSAVRRETETPDRPS